MKTSFKSLLALASAGLFALTLQAQPAPKIAVVDLAKLYDAHYKTEEQNGKLRSDEQRATEELEKLNKEGNSLVEQYKELADQAKNPAATGDAKAKAEQDAQKKLKEIQEKQGEVQNFRQSTQRSLQQRINTFKQILLEEISKLAVEIAKKRGATLVLDKSGPSLIGVSNVLYFDAAYDITEEVAKEINKDRPAGSPAPAAVPAAKPAASSSSEAPSVSFPGAKK